MFTFRGEHAQGEAEYECEPSPRNVNIALALNDTLYPLVVQCTIMCLRRVNSFYATVESSEMLCIMIQRNVMSKLNCAWAYYDTSERNFLLILLRRIALAPY